jgi:hypothetical protein
MPISYVDYASASPDQVDNGFEVTFEYLSDSTGVPLIDVYVEGVKIDRNLFTIVVDGSTTKAVINAGSVVAGNAVKVARNSSTEDPLVDFVDGSVLTEDTLDLSYKHGFYLSQEAAEGSGGELLSKKGGTDFDAEENKITNLADPTDAQDAATKAYVDTQDNAVKAELNATIDALTLADFTGNSLDQDLDVNGYRLVHVGNPLNATDGVNKQYVAGVADQLSLGTGNPPGVSKFTGTGSKTDFVLTFSSNHSNSSAYLVTLDGVVQDPADYSLVGGTNDIRFTTPPALGVEIIVIERGYRNAFSEIPSDYDYGTIAPSAQFNYDYGVGLVAVTAFVDNGLVSGSIANFIDYGSNFFESFATVFSYGNLI